MRVPVTWAAGRDTVKDLRVILGQSVTLASTGRTSDVVVFRWCLSVVNGGQILSRYTEHSDSVSEPCGNLGCIM